MLRAMQGACALACDMREGVDANRGCVAIMLLIPLDTSEAERIFSLMNDIKTSERSSLGQRNLANLMFWHYHGRNMKAWEVPVQEILKEFHELVKCSKRGRQAHPAAAPIKYEHKAEDCL